MKEDCQNIRELLTAYLDGEITPEEKAYIESHLTGCLECRAELEALSTMQSDLREALKLAADGVLPSVRTWQRVKDRLGMGENLTSKLFGLFSGGILWRYVAATTVIIVIIAAALVWQFGRFGGIAGEEVEEEESIIDTEESLPMTHFYAVPDGAYYSPGETIEIEISFTNMDFKGAITLEPFPPEIQIIPKRQDEAVFSVPAGSLSGDIEANGTRSIVFTWDQKNKYGEQVAPGWYQLLLNLKDIDIVNRTGANINQYERLYTLTDFLIQYPQGAMEKSLEPNQSETLDGITVILESIEMTSEGMTINAFNTPPGYIHPPTSSLPTSPFLIASAEYSVDGGTAKPAGSPGIRFLEYMEGTGIRFVEDGVRYTWMKLDPVPSDAKELTFRVRMSYNDKPEEALGIWEFNIPLEQNELQN